MKSLVLVLGLTGILITTGTGQQQPNGMDEWEALQMSLKTAKSVIPKNGFVPDQATAIKIGEAVAIAQYGPEMISKEQPFHARLYGGVWLVLGTLHPQGAYGGTAVAKVAKRDGRILFLTRQE